MMWLAPLLLAAAPAEPAAAACTAATASPVSVERLVANPRKWIGRCVTVSGAAWGQGLYGGVGGVYLARRWRGGWRHRIGLYRYGDAKRVEEGIRRSTVTGRADTCERIAAGAEAENAAEQARLDAEGKGEMVISMLTGYCHYRGGPIIHVAEEAAELGAAPARLVGKGARRRYGSLALDPPEWVKLGRARALAAEIRDALAAGDRERLSNLFGESGADDEELAYMLDRPDSPFREIRDPRRRPAIAVLVEEEDYGGRPLRRRADFNAFLCFCRGGNCADLWPIVDFDASNRPDQPFACVESEEDELGGRWLRVRIDEAPLAEPARTAFPARSSD
jgi:hypothetical protein